MDEEGGYEQNHQDGTSPNDHASPKKMKANQSLIPVTIKQILDADQVEDPLRIDGREITQLTFVGVIRLIQEYPTNFSYSVEDGTGSIDVKEWISKDDVELAEQKRNSRQVGMYIRVVGLMKTYNEKKHVMAFSLRIIEDFNEITHHFLQTIVAHLYNTRGPLYTFQGGAVVPNTPAPAPVIPPQRQQQQQQPQRQQQQQRPGQPQQGGQQARNFQQGGQMRQNPQQNRAQQGQGQQRQPPQQQRQGQQQPPQQQRQQQQQQQQQQQRQQQQQQQRQQQMQQQQQQQPKVEEQSEEMQLLMMIQQVIGEAENGIEFADIAQTLQTFASSEDIKNALDYMVSEMTIYVTEGRYALTQ